MSSYSQWCSMFSSRLTRLFLQTPAFAKTGRGSTVRPSEGHVNLTWKANKLSTLTQLHVSSNGYIMCSSHESPKKSALCKTLQTASSCHQCHLTSAIPQPRRRASTWESNFHLFSKPANKHYLQSDAGRLWAEQRRNAGHSKWQNIKHIKAAKDAQKMTVVTKITKGIRIAIREGGSPDPKANNQLARIIEQANQADVPKSTIENAIKNVVKANETGSTMFFDAKVPGSFMMIIETFTSSPKRTKTDLYTVFKRHGGQMNDKISTHFFDYKGVVVVGSDSSLPNLESAEEAAIMAEAEEVEQTLDDLENTVFQFICDFKNLQNVKTSLMEQYPEIDIREAGARYIPKNFTVVPESSLEAAAKLIDALESLEDVVRVSTNIKVEGSS